MESEALEKHEMNEREDENAGEQENKISSDEPAAILEIREMTREDIPHAAALEAAIFSVPWSEKGFLSALTSPDTLYLVLCRKEKVVGYCGFWQSFDEAEITNVAVEETCRGQGAGTVLVAELLARGRARGVTRFILEVRESNEAALRLYRKLGFETAGIRKNFYEQPKENAVIMWKV